MAALLSVAGIPQPPRQQTDPKGRGPPARDRPRPRMAALLSVASASNKEKEAANRLLQPIVELLPPQAPMPSSKEASAIGKHR